MLAGAARRRSRPSARERQAEGAVHIDDLRDRPCLDDLPERVFVEVEVVPFTVAMEVSPIIQTTQSR